MPLGIIHWFSYACICAIIPLVAVVFILRSLVDEDEMVPALSSLARLRRISNAPSYPVGLKRRGSRGFSNTDFQISTIHAKAKNEMLANLVLPVLRDSSAIHLRERRITCHYYSPSVVTSKEDVKRLHIATEILDTEKRYLASLTTLQKVFEEPLRQSHLISEKEMDLVFPKELEHIRLIHTLFMKDLEERVQNWKLQGIMGDIFTKLSSSYHIDVLRIYSTYVNNFPKAIAVINKCSRSSQKFRKFLQNCSTRHECEGLDLPAFLLTPIQRLPRYVLLLRQMSKNTDTTHPDSFHVNNALETMKQMINVLNDSIQNSSKLAHSSTLHKNVKRRKLRKRSTLRATHHSMKESQDSSSRLSVDSNQSSLSAVSGISVEISAQQSTQVRSSQESEGKNVSPNCREGKLEEEAPATSHSPGVQMRVKNKEKKPRPLSNGGESSDLLSESESYSEFATITEESQNEDKDKPSSKLRTAAGNMINNWKRRSKIWRRSFDSDSEKAVVEELDQQLTKYKKDNPESPEHSFENKDALLSPPATGEGSGSYTNLACVALDETLSTKDNDKLQSSSENSKTCKTSQDTLPVPTGNAPLDRPKSLFLPLKCDSDISKGNLCENRVSSDGDICGEKSRLPSPVWVRQKDLRLLSGTLPENATSLIPSTQSSIASSDAGSAISTSRRSLLNTSQDSLNDSGVSTENSPTNTLTTRRKPRVSKALSLANSSGDTQRKLTQYNRRSWGEWVATEMEQTPVSNNDNVDSIAEEHDHLDKSKRTFKKVVKQLFTAKKKQNASHISEVIPASRISLQDKQNQTSFHKAKQEKISIV